MDNDGIVWRDGELVSQAGATCHVLSHMAARGSQVFDVIPVTRLATGPAAVGLRPHITRFLRSAELMGMEDVAELAVLEQAVADTVLANVGLGDGGRDDGADHDGPFVVKIVAAWMEEGIGVLPLSLRPTVFVLAVPAGGGWSPGVLQAPASVRSSAMPKIPPEILPPSIKVAASYTPGLREQIRSQALGFDHTVFRSLAGDLAESTTLSMLVVSGDRIVVPPLDTVLDGITRRVLLDAADDAGVPVEVRPVAWSEVEGADELVLCSSTHPVVPVGRLDDRHLEAPGPVTVAVGRGVEAILKGDHPSSERWLTPLKA